MLNPRESTPLYLGLRELLRGKLAAGEYPPDQAIPSERELCRAYGVSRITVRQAIAGLIHEGLLYRRPGKGTYAAPRKVSQGLSRFVSFAQTVEQIGLAPATRILFAGSSPPDPEAAAVLGLDPEEPCARLELLGLGDGRPLVVYDSLFAPGAGEAILSAAGRRERAGRPFSTYELWEETPGLRPVRVRQTLEALCAAGGAAKALAVKPGQALLRVVSVFEDRRGRPLEFRRALYRGDLYKFHVVRDLAG
ncbi:MAG: GntR family transcriptional regulator [Desulfobacterales bacterium]